MISPPPTKNKEDIERTDGSGETVTWVKLNEMPDD